MGETKRQIMVVIRIHVDKSLLDILEAPVTESHERAFAEYLKLETEQALSRKEAQDKKTASSVTASPNSDGGISHNDAPATPGSILGLLQHPDGSRHNIIFLIILNLIA